MTPTYYVSLNHDQILKEIYDYCKKRGKRYFYKDSFIIHLWFKYKWQITLEWLFVELRRLAREGFLVKGYKRSPRNPNTRLVIYIANLTKIENYLRTKGLKV